MVVSNWKTLWTPQFIQIHFGVVRIELLNQKKPKLPHTNMYLTFYFEHKNHSEKTLG